jgi:hypothetical protein
LPYSAYIDGDINGDRNAFNDVAPGTTWNQYRLPYQGSLDRALRAGSRSAAPDSYTSCGKRST